MTQKSVSLSPALLFYYLVHYLITCLFIKLFFNSISMFFIKPILLFVSINLLKHHKIIIGISSLSQHRASYSEAKYLPPYMLEANLQNLLS